MKEEECELSLKIDKMRFVGIDDLFVKKQSIRERYENMYFLIPGYGAQGARGSDVKLYLNEKNGGVVNSSRGIIKAYAKHEDGNDSFEKYTREAVLSMREDIGYEG